jgi:nitrate reductase gamma subunit
MKTAILYQISPYAAVLLFGAGMAIRYYRLAGDVMNANRPRSIQSSDRSGAGRLLRLSLILLLLGHAAGLLFPHWIQVWNGVPYRLYLIEVSAFVIGVSALAGWGLVIWRHLKQSDEPIAMQAADAVFYALLFMLLLSGSLTAILFRWGSAWGVQTLTPYALSLVHGQPAVGLIVNLPYLVRLHVFASFASLALFPATSLARTPIALFRCGLARASAPVHRLVDFSGKVGARLNPAIWIWPEED